MDSGVLLLGAVVVAVAAAAWFLLRPTTLPAIAADLPFSSENANRIFAERVKEAYPLGSSVAKMRTELAQQGFDLDQAIVPGWDGSAQVVNQNIFCSKVWFIEWQVGDSGRLGDLLASYSGRCIWD